MALHLVKAKIYPPVSTITTLLIAFVLITPLCGFLYQCGCEWPWQGLDAKCNFYIPESQHRCPWCLSLPSGVLSSGLAVFSTVILSRYDHRIVLSNQSINNTVFRLFIRLCLFITVATLTAWLSAQTQNYPLGIGQYYAQ